MEENIKFESETEERFILAYLIKDKSFFLKIVKHLKTADSNKKSYFKDLKLQWILNFADKYYDKYDRIPSLETYKIALEKGFQNDPLLKKALSNCVDEIFNKDLSKIEPKYIKDETISFVKTMKAYEATNLNRLDIENGNFDNLSKRLQDAVNINLDKDLGLSLANSKETLSLIQEAEEDSGLTFGSLSLDRILGSPKAGEITVFCGTPGIGKTIWLGNVAVENMKKGKKGVFFSLEVDRKRLAKRLYSSLLGKDGKSLQTETSESVKNILDMYGNGDIRIKNYSANVANCNDFANYLMDLYTIEGFQPDFIVIDYILITAPNSKQMAQGDNSYAKYKTVTEEMRNLASQFNCPVFTAAQINRNGMADKDLKGGAKQVITSKDLSESRGILDTADYLLVINQDVAEKKKAENDGIGEQRLYIDKNRNGSSGSTLNFTIDYNTFIIKEGKKTVL